MEAVIAFALNVWLGSWLLAWTVEKVGKWELKNGWSVCFCFILAKFLGIFLGVGLAETTGNIVLGQICADIGFLALLTYCVFCWTPNSNLKRTLKIMAAYIPLVLALSFVVNFMFAER
ncbi:MAG: hypothetical protein IKW13_04310 [Thermoguttaceae bacterium]|nr:hypothetical protein [Thermoguttaceae bacterium]